MLQGNSEAREHIHGGGLRTLEKWSSRPQSSSLPLHPALQAAYRPACMKIRRLIQTIRYRVLGLPILMPSPPVSPSPFHLRTIPNSDTLSDPKPSSLPPQTHAQPTTPTSQPLPAVMNSQLQPPSRIQNQAPSPLKPMPSPHSHLQSPTLCDEFPTPTPLSDLKPSSLPPQMHAQAPLPPPNPYPLW